MPHASFFHLFDPGKYGIDLECEAPPGRLLIVSFQHVDAFPAQILPILHWFFDPNRLRKLLSQNLQKCRFATANVAFNSEAAAFRFALRWTDRT